MTVADTTQEALGHFRDALALDPDFALVVTLKEALQRVIEGETACVELIVDDEHFSIIIKDGRVRVRYEAYPDAPTAVATNYDALVAAADRSIELSTSPRTTSRSSAERRKQPAPSSP